MPDHFQHGCHIAAPAAAEPFIVELIAVLDRSATPMLRQVNDDCN